MHKLATEMAEVKHRGSQIQNRERAGVPARAARVGWWSDRVNLRTETSRYFTNSMVVNHQPVATVPGSVFVQRSLSGKAELTPG